MKRDTRIFDLLARLLTYPTADYEHAVHACQQVLRNSDSSDGEPLAQFAEFARTSPLEELEELFTRTFDLNPVCCLEVGWQLYGEDYNRGDFMVKMRQQLRAHGVPESIELPDHLANLLPLLGRLSSEEAGRLAAASILPALAKMQTGLEGNSNPYEEVLAVVRELLEPLAAPYPKPRIPLTQIQRKEDVVHG